ncbi:membrane protein [Salmonella enterica subsp. enterica serovar Choleraesuis]|nr:membrane protein [Salmonella enterica subsp. enterica serovar Choleraesuis]
MRESSPFVLPTTESSGITDETSWSLSGGAIGFVAWLVSLGLPFILFGASTPFILMYTWPFFLALLPVAVLTGVALHALLGGRLRYSVIATLLAVMLMCGFLLRWLMS